MLDIIQLFLISKATKYCRLDGNTKVEDRLQMVTDFNDPDSNTTVFLISTKAGGVGLNLQSATNVVLFDPSWNPAHDCQAQDRAYRIGQTKDVHVYRLITLGTIEEMIYVRQIYKQQLSDTTLKGSKAPRYFEGVQGNPNQKCELFGLKNLLCWKAGGVLKDIQDAYQRGRDGLMMQQNQVRYDTAAMKKSTKKAKAKVRDEPIDDESEMIEVADEMVADMLVKDIQLTQASAEAKASDGSERSGDDDVDALLGATTFRHEEIVGDQEEQDDQEDYHIVSPSGTSVIVLDETESDLDTRQSGDGVVELQNLSPSKGVLDLTNEGVCSPGRKLPQSKHAMNTQKNAESNEGRSRLYLPQY
ncbi:DNA excision repair protein ERCC-6-like 2 [Phytophthora boehmeriae]|uniref:DNA excision repair protein ERCC-6-like 2 n=1 Tax=Phytophthora boehmeriae TaxID=109152 RepID=A0A8T1WLN1_9STRA|nr:DNA excision repair protein ERCC-6-like 2 [Phytophthora boehmeriae]